MTMRLYRLPTPDYEWGYDDDGKRVGDGNWWHNQVYSIDVDMSDTSITTGGDYWTVDGRTYVEVHGPIYSGHQYIIEWYVYYAPDSRPSIYLASQDVANDDLMDTHIHIAHTASPDTTYKRTYRWEMIRHIIRHDQWIGLRDLCRVYIRAIRRHDEILLRLASRWLVHIFYHDVTLRHGRWTAQCPGGAHAGIQQQP